MCFWFIHCRALRGALCCCRPLRKVCVFVCVCSLREVFLWQVNDHCLILHCRHALTQTNTHSTGLPWPFTQSTNSASAPALAPPRLTRPLSDVWCTSATLHTLDGGSSSNNNSNSINSSSSGTVTGSRDVLEPSQQLKRALGWDTPPRASVLCAQLLELGRQHAVDAQVC